MTLITISIIVATCIYVAYNAFLAAIASRMGKTYGMIFKFKTHRDGTRTITRVL